MANRADSEELNLSLDEKSKSQSITRRLEKHFDKIQEYLDQGVSRAAILEQLNTMGFSLSMRTFATMLQRIRKRRREATGQAVSNRRKAATPPDKTAISNNQVVEPKPQKFEYDPHSEVGWQPKSTERNKP